MKGVKLFSLIIFVTSIIVTTFALCKAAGKDQHM